MFRVRRIHDAVLPINKLALRKVAEILRAQFPLVSKEEVDALPDLLQNPFRKRFRAVIFVAERKSELQGFALVLHEPDLRFAYLDYIATAVGTTGGGLGGALYDRVREEAAVLACEGLFFECLPDEPESCPDAALREANATRLKFYERYGARPIVGTAYETPIIPGSLALLPHLVYDGLDPPRPLRRDYTRAVVRAILERKYAHLCSPEYVQHVVASIVDDPVRLREFRYVRPRAAPKKAPAARAEPIALVVNDRHGIHHIRERGYFEAPVRVSSILAELGSSGLFEKVAPRAFGDEAILAVHDADFVDYVRRACAKVPAGETLYPYVFPLRNRTRPPKDVTMRAGYYCMDTFTPLNANVYRAARRSVDCALTAAHELLAGRRLAYALVRPPGHHAERRFFGGFCYLNSNAIAAQALSAHGRVAILDIDYHHGNGQQEIFYERADVLTVSIHGHPSIAYPFFTGFEDERGSGAGLGMNLNIPLPEKQDGAQYLRALRRAVDAIASFAPTFLVVALGLDPAKGDPTGSWSLAAADFEANGRTIAELALPTLVVQEGGYRTRTLGTNARRFFEGLASGGRRST